MFHMLEIIFVASRGLSMGIPGAFPRRITLNQARPPPRLGNKAYSVSNSKVVCYTICFF
jgi:hypothetical protein